MSSSAVHKASGVARDMFVSSRLEAEHIFLYDSSYYHNLVLDLKLQVLYFNCTYRTCYIDYRITDGADLSWGGGGLSVRFIGGLFVCVQGVLFFFFLSTESQKIKVIKKQHRPKQIPKNQENIYKKKTTTTKCE